jgi:hypothetical protein
MKSNEEVVKKYWKLFDEAKFAEAGELMVPHAVIRWWNTREEFKERDKFIEANRMYPGRWKINIERLECIGDLVISVVKVAGADISFYATSFFTLKEQLIVQIDEYWGENSEAPEWRRKAALAEIF